MVVRYIEFNRKRARFSWFLIAIFCLPTYPLIAGLWPGTGGFLFAVMTAAWAYMGSVLLYRVLAATYSFDNENILIHVEDCVEAAGNEFDFKSVEFRFYFIRLVDIQNKTAGPFVFIAIAFAGSFEFIYIVIAVFFGFLAQMGKGLLREMCAAALEVGLERRLSNRDWVSFRLEGVRP